MAKKKKKLMPKEEWEQMQIFIWRKKWIKEFPRLELLHASLNGVKLSMGLAMKMVRLGMVKGIPDMQFPAWSFDKKYHGLFIELKRRGEINKVSVSQKRILKMLEEEGYFVCVCEGFHEAIDVIAEWIGLSEEERWSKEVGGLRPKI